MIYLKSAEIRPPEHDIILRNTSQPGWQPVYCSRPGRAGELILTFELTPDCQMNEVDELRRRLRGFPCYSGVEDFLKPDLGQKINADGENPQPLTAEKMRKLSTLIKEAKAVMRDDLRAGLNADEIISGQMSGLDLAIKAELADCITFVSED